MSKEEREQVLEKWASDMIFGETQEDALQKATLRHIYEEGEKVCPHLNDDVYSPQVQEKWKCFKCREELKREAGVL